MAKKMTNEEFLLKASKKHDLSEYDWSDFEPINEQGERVIAAAECISKAARSNGLKKTLGFHICYKENYSREDNQWLGKERGNMSPKLGKRQISDMNKSILFNKTNFGTKIICNETGEEFNSIKECCEKLKIKHNDIKNFLNGKRKYPIAGYKFKCNN